MATINRPRDFRTPRTINLPVHKIPPIAWRCSVTLLTILRLNIPVLDPQAYGANTPPGPPVVWKYVPLELRMQRSPSYPPSYSYSYNGIQYRQCGSSRNLPHSRAVEEPGDLYKYLRIAFLFLFGKLSSSELHTKHRSQNFEIMAQKLPLSERWVILNKLVPRLETYEKQYEY